QPVRIPATEDEQRAIAHILGTLDDKIELNRRMSETLEAIARALFESWFVRFDPVRRNMARKGHGQPSPRPAGHPSPIGRGEGSEGAKHYRGGYDFAGLVETARALRKKQTPAEAVFWELVRDRRLLGLKFRRQHQLGDYVADFYCHERRLVIELDGGVRSKKKPKDHKRDAWMAAQGFHVLRFKNEQLLDDPESVLTAIAHAVEEPPSPSRRRAGDEGVIEGAAFDHLFPDRFVPSELGEIPEGWEMGTLGDVADHPRRGIPPDSIEPDTPYIALEHMPKRCIALCDWGAADGLASNKCEFRKGEILFGKLRPYFHKVAVAPVDGVCSTDIVVVAPKGKAWFGFVLGHVSSVEFVEYTNAGSTGTKMPRTSWAEMARYRFALPPQAVAGAFTKTLQPFVDRIIAGIHESRTLAALRDALLPKLISGELRVKDAERFLVQDMKNHQTGRSHD
ncbi:MAG: DUF559 domain-containing protein, partial [Armatimonadota bacterium]|nr:DUF559 domain-containing protein [Armatimonadota bacterium]